MKPGVQARRRSAMLPYGRQWVDEADIAAVAEVLRGDHLTTGPAGGRFEEAFATKVGAASAVVCSSGTAALHLASLALDIGPGDRVIVPALTFLATANAPRLAGAEVVFADVDARSGLMGVEHFKQAMNRAGGPVKAVFPVHLNGQSCALEAISAVAHDKGVRVVEDACHALGTSYASDDGNPHLIGAAAHSDLVCFSFHPVKTIAMGEGGAVTCRDARLSDRMRRLRSHGMERRPQAFQIAAQAFDADGGANPWYYEMAEIGLNYRASDIHCALGLSQLSKMDQFAAKRRMLAGLYDERLAGLAPLLNPVAKVAACDAVLHLYAVLIDFEAAGMTRAQLMSRLAERGLGTQVHYLPVHLQPYYRQRYGVLELPGAWSYYSRCLSLPLHQGMAAEDVHFVVDALEEILKP